MQVLVDGDILVYRCGFAAERTEYAVQYHDAEFGEDTTVWCENKKSAKALASQVEERGHTPEIIPRVNLEPVSHALHNVKSMIDDALYNMQASSEEVHIILSGPSDENFRHDIATLKGYKANRDEKHKPTHGPAIRDYMKRNWKTTTTVNEEADDMLGYLQYAAWREDPHSSVIVTTDKDLKMIMGLHWNPVKKEAVYMDEHEAELTFWKQLICGDSTDNIGGVPGIGEKLSERAYADTTKEEWYDIALSLYVQEYGEDGYAAMLENGQLIWIRREEGQLWQPELLTT